MAKPNRKNVVELSSAETDEVIQYFSLRAGDETFGEGVRFGLARRYTDASHIRIQKDIELVEIPTIAITDEKPGLDALIFHPHRSVASLMRYPLRIGMISGRATRRHPTSQMDGDKYIGAAGAAKCKDALSEKVAGHHRLQMRMNRGGP